MKLFIPIVFIALLFSCGNSKEIAEPSNAQNQEETVVKPNKTNPEITKKEDNTSHKIKTEKSIEIKAHFGEFVESDIIQINSAEISGNNLLLSVTYSGGCKEHSFDMIGSQNISKSLPPIRQIRLIHNGNEDHCRELITRTLSVDLRDMAYNKTSGSEIVLNLKGAREPLNYIFQ